jgi:hypothetical protein
VLLYYLDFLIVTVYIYIYKYINLILTKQQGVGYKLVSKFHNTNTRPLGMICDFPINFNIKPTKVLSLIFNKTNHKTPSGLSTEIIKSTECHCSHMHTCLSNKNKYIKNSIFIHHKQDKCI